MGRGDADACAGAVAAKWAARASKPPGLGEFRARVHPEITCGAAMCGVKAATLPVGRPVVAEDSGQIVTAFWPRVHVCVPLAPAGAANGPHACRAAVPRADPAAGAAPPFDSVGSEVQRFVPSWKYFEQKWVFRRIALRQPPLSSDLSDYRFYSPLTSREILCRGRHEVWAPGVLD